MTVVIDASIALSWCFSDERTPETDNLLNEIAINTAVVPALWIIEVSNALVMAERRKRITSSEIRLATSLLEKLPIEINEEATQKGFHEILSLARDEKLTAYDATYLELALRLGFPLATKDQLLARVAKKLGVVVI
jgi:predicted nucleic acid-binding protein